MTKYVKSIKFSTSGETYVIRDAEQKSRLDTLEPVVATKADSATVDAALAGKQATLVSGENIKTINNQSILGSGNISIGGSGGTTDYDQLDNRPQIAGTTLTGNKSLADLGIAAASDLSGKQDKLTSANAGSNVTITEESGVVKINATGGGSGTSDYSALDNKPQINGVTLSGNKTAADLELLTSSDVGTMAAESKDDYYTKTAADDEFLSSNQGSENTGKVLGIDSTGEVVPVSASGIVTPEGEASILDNSQPKNLFGSTTTQEEVDIETVIVDRSSTCAYEASAATNGPFIVGNQTAERGKQLASVSFMLKTKNPDSDYYSFYIANLGRSEITAASQISSYITNWRTGNYVELFRVQVASGDLLSVQNYKLDGSDDRVVYMNPDFLDSEGYLVIPENHFICFGDPLNLTNFGYSRGSTHPEDPNAIDFFYLNDGNNPETHPSNFSKSTGNLGYVFYERDTTTEEVTTQNFDEYLVTKEEETVTEYVNAAPTPTDYASTRAYQGGLYWISNCSHWNGKLLKAVSYCPRSGNTGVFKVGFPSTGTNDFTGTAYSGVTVSGIRTLFTINPGDDGYTAPGGYSDKMFMLDGSDPRVTIVATDLYDSVNGGFLWNQTMLLAGDDRANENSSAADKEAGTYTMAWFCGSGPTNEYWGSHCNAGSITGEEGNESCTLASHSSDSILIHMYTEETRTIVNETVHSDVIAQALADIEELKAGETTDSPLKGKYLSIIGDSISTFSGWSNIAPGSTSAAIYYPKDWLNDVNQTYWKKLVDRTGMNLLVNNSWSGSECAGSASSSSCVVSQTNNRCHQLHKNGINPDYILINIGTNDFDHDFELGVWNGRGEKFPDNPETTSPSTFREAYAVMLYRLRIYYPLARVFCCTIPCGNNEGDGFNEINGKGYSLAEWNDAIREVATAFGCKVIEMATAGMDYYTLSTLYGDGRLHPSEAGMERMYEIIRAYMENNISSNATAIRRSTYVATNQGTANAGKIMAVGSDGKVAATTAAYVSNNQGSGNAGKVLGIDSTGAVVPVAGGGGSVITPAGEASVFDDSQPVNLFGHTEAQDIEYFQTDVITPEMSSTHRGPSYGIYYPAGTCYNDICGKYISAVKFLVWNVVENSPWEVYIRDWQTDDLHNITPSSTAPATSDILLFKVQPVAADQGNYVTFALDGSDPRITNVNQDYVVDGMIHIPAQHYMGLHATADSGVSSYGYTQSGQTVATPQTFVYTSSGGSVSVNQGTLFYDVSYQTATHASEESYTFDNYVYPEVPVYDSELTVEMIPTSGTLNYAKGQIYFLTSAVHSQLNGKALSAVEFYGVENRTAEFVIAGVTDNTNMPSESTNTDIADMFTETMVPDQYVLFRITPTSTDTTTPTLYMLDGSDPRVELVNTSHYDNVQKGFVFDQTMLLGVSDRQNPNPDVTNTTASFQYQTAVTGGITGFAVGRNTGSLTYGSATSSLNLNWYTAVATGETTRVWNSELLQTGLMSGTATAVADATDTSDVVTQFNALLAILRTRGVIAASE